MALHPHTAQQRKRIQANRKTALTARKKNVKSKRGQRKS